MKTNMACILSAALSLSAMAADNLAATSLPTQGEANLQVSESLRREAAAAYRWLARAQNGNGEQVMRWKRASRRPRP